MCCPELTPHLLFHAGWLHSIAPCCVEEQNDCCEDSNQYRGKLQGERSRKNVSL